MTQVSHLRLGMVLHLSKRSSSIFSIKISFYPMPDAIFLKISDAKLELLLDFGIAAMNWWRSICPWSCLLQLSCQAKKCCLVPEPTRELHTDRHIFLIPKQRYRHCGLTCYIIDIGQRGQGVRHLGPSHWIVWHRPERTEFYRGNANCRGQDHIIASLILPSG